SHVIFFIIAVIAGASFRGSAAFAGQPPAWFAAEGSQRESTTSGSGCSLSTALSTATFKAFSANPPVKYCKLFVAIGLAATTSSSMGYVREFDTTKPGAAIPLAWVKDR